MRYLIAALVMGLLTACSLGATSPSEQPLPSIGDSVEQSTEPSTEASESSEASPSEDMTAMGCADAWSNVDTSQVSSIADLEAIASDLEATLELCDTLDDWTSEASTALPDLDISAVESWAATRCSADDTLSQTPVCMELSS